MSNWLNYDPELIIKLSKICFLCTYLDQIIVQQRFNVLLQIQFYNIFANVVSIIFSRIYNKIP